jgi:hypothetical protein
MTLSIAGSFALVLVVLVVVFAGIKKAIARAAEALSSEGVELDSGPVTVTTRFQKFRSPEILAAGGIRRNPARIVLTKQRLHILQRPQRYGIFDRDKLSHFTVTIEGGALKLESSDPPGASGSVSYSVEMPELDRWVSALVAAGAKRAA